MMRFSIKTVIFFSLATLSLARFKQVKLFNWSYKDFDTTAFNDVSFSPRVTFSDYDTSQCPNGWVHYADSCYWVENESLSFAQAEQKCYEKNATLIVFNSNEEWEAVRAHSQKTSHSWIGLVRFSQYEKTEDAPRWQTEGAINPTKLDWLIRPYEPVANGWSTLSNCAAHFNPVGSLDSVAFTYFYPCSFLFTSICERNTTILDFLNRRFDFQP